jgi:hypothetical protein
MAKTTAPESLRVSAQLPMLDRWRDRIDPGDGQLMDLEFLWMTLWRWRRHPASAAPGWRVRRLGPFVMAYRPR